MREIWYVVVTFTAGVLVGYFFSESLRVLASRSGTVGGEVLFLPLMVLVFYLGWTAKSKI